MATMTAATSKVTRDETRRAVNDVNNRHIYLQQNLPEIGSVIPMKASSSRNMNKFESKMTSFHDLNTKDLETKVMKVQ